MTDDILIRRKIESEISAANGIGSFTKCAREEKKQKINQRGNFVVHQIKCTNRVCV